MNPVSLYITTSRLVFQSGGGGGPGGTDSANGAGSCGPGSSTFTDLNRLLPYLRKSLSCAVCCRLLLEPHTPAELNCQHHVCRGCVGERKKLKPSCASCKDYNRYVENTQLRMLLQCYKSICEYIKTKPFFAEIRRQASALNGISMTVVGGGASNSPSDAGAAAAATTAQTISVPSNLWELIEEGARFQDNYRCSSGLTKSAYSILPCIYPAPTVMSPNVVATQPMASTNIPQGQQIVISSSTGSSTQMHASKSHLVAAHTDHVASNSSSSSSASYTVTSANIPADHTVVQQQSHQPQQPQLVVQGRPTPHQQQQNQQQKEIKFRSAPIKTVSNGSTMYSVLYAGNGNKITIKRKTDPPHVQRRATIHTLDKDGQLKLAKTLAENNSTVSAASSSVVGFKMPTAQTTTATLASAASSGMAGTTLSGQSAGSSAAAVAAAAANSSKQSAKQLLKRRGCRCGNATATPGKLTCCGQRCPCYVDSKSCVDCKCRGCRNPHRADGMKVRPHIPELQNLEINLHNPNVANEALSTATTTVLATAPQSTSDVSPVVGSGHGGTTTLLQQHQQQQQSTGLTLGSMGTLVSGKGLSQINLLGSTTGGNPTPGSTLKITPTSLANVLNSTNQLVSTSHDGIGLVPSTGLLDASGFSYLTPGTLDVSGVTGTAVQVQGGPTQYTMPVTSLANGGTIHVVNVYTTHLGDVSCSPTLSNMIRTDSALNSLLTHKPPEALLTTQQTSSIPSSSTIVTGGSHHHPTLIGHSLFNPVSTTVTSGMDTTGSTDLVGEVGTIVDLNDQIDLTGANLITIDGTSLDDRLQHGGSSEEDV